jgi:hypothetical protein
MPEGSSLDGIFWDLAGTKGARQRLCLDGGSAERTRLVKSSRGPEDKVKHSKAKQDKTRQRQLRSRAAGKRVVEEQDSQPIEARRLGFRLDLGFVLHSWEPAKCKLGTERQWGQWEKPREKKKKEKK